MAGQTIEVSLGSPSPNASFQIPPKLVPFVDSVYAEVNNSAGAATTPTLEVAGPNGDTVAAVPQDSPVAGGNTGRLTWALRLAAKPAAASTAFAAGWASLFDNNITVPTGAVYTQYDFTPAAFYTNDSTTFTVDAANGLKLNSNGWYQLTAILSWDVAAAAASYAEMVWNIPNVARRFSYSVFADIGGVEAVATTYQTWGFPMKNATVGSHGKLFLRHFCGADSTCALSFGIARLSSSSGNF